MDREREVVDMQRPMLRSVYRVWLQTDVSLAKQRGVCRVLSSLALLKHILSFFPSFPTLIQFSTVIIPFPSGFGIIDAIVSQQQHLSRM